MVECQICHKIVKQITSNGHLRVHNINFKEYKELFPNSNTIDDTVRNDISIANSGRHFKHKNHRKYKPLSEQHKINIGIGVKTSEKYQEAIKNPERGKKISESLIGCIGSMHGKTHPIETIEKMRESAINRNTSEYKKQISDTVKELWQNEEYRKNQEKSTPKRSLAISTALRGKIPKNCGKGGNGCYYNSPLQGKVWLRSSYELAYAKYLDENKILWMYEMETFDLGDTSYTPDFFLPKFEKFVEIKGYMSNIAQEKIDKFLEQYPWDLEILYKEDLIELGVL